MKVRQHIPDFITGVDPINFDDIEPSSLFELAFIKDWSNKKSFIRFMIDYGRCPALMVEMKESRKKCGKSFWVIAILTPPEEAVTLGLPKFNIKDYQPFD